MTVPHEPWLVALSIAIAIQGSFVGLSLARELDSAEGFRRRLALAGSALTLATGVWSMHFVGMLAANFPSAIDYLVLPTLVSFLICVIVVGVGVYAAHAAGPPALRVGVGRAGDGARHQPHALRRHVGGASGRADLARAPVSSSPRSRSRSAPARSPCGRSTAGRRGRGCSSARSCLGWRSPACIIPRWRGCGSTRCASTFPASSGPNSALSRNTLALLATVVSFGVSGAFLLSLVPDGAARRAALRPSPPRRGDRCRPPRMRRNRRPVPRRRPLAPRPSSVSKRTGARANSRSTTSTPSAPTRITPMSMTANRNISATCRSARSRRASIRKRSCECTAAISSPSTELRGSNDRAKPASRNWACLCGAASRSRAPTIGRSNCGSGPSPADGLAVHEMRQIIDAFRARNAPLAPFPAARFMRR